MKFGFIGAGNMGGALARAVYKSKTAEVVVADKDNQKAIKLAEELSAVSDTVENIAKNSKYIFLGVKPQVLKSVLLEILPILEKRNDRFVLVSMAAGVEITSIYEIIGKEYPIIRIMPNTPVSVGKGMILYTASNVQKEELLCFCEALKYAGKLDEIDESLIDAASAVSGCGPAFVFQFADAIAKAGSSCGLDNTKALEYAAQTLIGAAELLLTAEKTPDELTEQVCSPGGSTIEGVKVLKNSDFEKILEQTITASYNRTKELGK